jgi:hypothetical protein
MLPFSRKAKGLAEGPATMRLLSVFAVTAALSVPLTAGARTFWQTYGATVPADGGCEWNVNQDYFVPRKCGDGAYDLFSPCKKPHYRSPACKSLNPIYTCYCTPYGPCHYIRKDHVYKERCGCTPLRCEYGSWHLERCPKHCLALKEPCGCMAGEAIGRACPACERVAGLPVEGASLCHVEPLGGTILGNIAALPAATTGGGGTGMMGMMNGGGAMNPGAMMNMGAGMMNQGGGMFPPAGIPSGVTPMPAPAQNPIPKIPTPPGASGSALPPVF